MSAADASALSFWSFVSVVGIVLVILGVSMEGAEIFARRKAKRRAKRSFFPDPSLDKIPDWAHSIGDWGWIILVIGLSLEMAGHFGEGAIKDRENARLNTVASELNERAAILERQNLELYAKIQPRRISTEQRAQLVTLMGTNTKPGIIRVSVQATDGEAVVFANQINEVLRLCAFETEYSNRAILADSTPVGLVLFVKSLASPPMQAATVYHAFNKVGLTLAAAENNFFPTNEVRLLVGSKP